MTLILNQLFEQAFSPEIIRTTQVWSIDKREITVTVCNYSSISLLSVFRKTFEKALHHGIYSFLYRYKLINTNHIGFRSSYSSEYALISSIEIIKKSLDNDEIVRRGFIDLQNSFNTTNHEILLETLTIMN